MDSPPEGRGTPAYVALFRPIVDEMISQIDAMSLVLRDAEEAFTANIANKLEGNDDEAQFDKAPLEMMVQKVAKAKAFSRLLNVVGIEEGKRSGLYERYLDYLFWVPGRTVDPPTRLAGGDAELISDLREQLERSLRAGAKRKGRKGT